MRILVLGKTGMLGHVVFNYFKERDYEVYGTSTKEDIKYDAFGDMEAIESIIKDIKPNVVINCIGILNKAAEDNKFMAVKLNSLLPHYLDSISEKYGFKLIHISTDCVFSGLDGNYTEDSLPDATSFYGRSKALGEINNDRNVTLRTSIVGPDSNPKGIGLFQWFMSQNDKVYGYSKVIWTGVTTIELAKVIESTIKNNITGLQHVVNNSTIPKYELLKLFKNVFNKKVDIEINDELKSEKTLIRTEKSFDYNIPSYEGMIKEMKEWVDSHKDLYPNL